MQFVSLPVITLLRPTAPSLSLVQVMSCALAADFNKYVLAFTLNDLCQSQKDQKKSENAETNISSSSLQEMVHGNSFQKIAEEAQKNRKQEDFNKITYKNELNNETILPRKRLCYEKARSQITQAFDSAQQSLEPQVEQSNQEQQRQIENKNKIENKIQLIKENGNRKSKKIKKGKKVQKAVPMSEAVPKFQISTVVSLIDTIDHPRITIDRLQIQQKRNNLLARAIIYDQFQQRKCNYQIRQRRQLKRLN